MRILITGSNGFVGSPLSDRLEDIGHEIIRVQRRNKTEEFYIENIDRLTEWGELLEGVDLVIHCAAKAHQTYISSEDESYTEINTEGTKNLALQSAKKGINKFIFISTIKVYGEVNKDNRPYSLTSEEQPIDSYAKSKFNAEKALYTISEKTNMQVIIIRCPLVYGPNVRANFLNLIKIVEKSLPLPFKSIISASLFASVFFTFFPIAFTFPLSFNIKEPFSSIFCDGSIILALIKIFSFIYLQYFFKQAILTATPNSTCSLTKLTFMSSASFVSISTPLFIGPGCIISASFFANFNFSGVKP